jgi:hypothetical protein
MLSTHLRLGLPSGLLPSGFPTNILYAYEQVGYNIKKGPKGIRWGGMDWIHLAQDWDER